MSFCSLTLSSYYVMTLKSIYIVPNYPLNSSDLTGPKVSQIRSQRFGVSKLGEGFTQEGPEGSASRSTFKYLMSHT